MIKIAKSPTGKFELDAHSFLFPLLFELYTRFSKLTEMVMVSRLVETFTCSTVGANYFKLEEITKTGACLHHRASIDELFVKTISY